VKSCLAALLLALALIPGTALAEEQKQWLVTSFKSRDLQSAIRAENKLHRQRPQAGIIASSDCSNISGGYFLTVVAAAPTMAAAAHMLSQLKARGDTAYIQECTPRPGSRLMLGIPLIDPSIRHVPPDAVNWTDADRISTVVKLDDDGYLWFRRWYEADREDPREGRRVSVLFVTHRPQSAHELEQDCSDPSFAVRGKWLALDCAREAAAENLFHQLKVYELPSGKPAFSIQRCRQPQFESETALTCQAEQVDSEGELRLSPKRVRFR
jgi:hypothetical protein